MRNQYRRILISGFVVFVALCFSPPLRGAEVEGNNQTKTEEITGVALKDPLTDAGINSYKATTTVNPSLPISELELLVKPLTLGELQNEAKAWMVLVKEKTKEISDSEIAINRQNLAINKQKEAAKTLEQAQQALAEAAKAHSIAAPGSPEYLSATKKLQDAKDNLDKAQKSVTEASAAQKTLKKEKNLSNAVDKAKETNDLESAQDVLSAAKNALYQLDSNSVPYDLAAKKIDELQGAIAAFSEAQKAKEKAKTGSPEQKEATQKQQKALIAMKKARDAINLPEVTKTDQSKETLKNLDKSAADVNKISVDSDKSTKTSDTLNKPGQIKNKEQQLNQAADKLQKNAEKQSDLKDNLVVSVTQLESERTGLIDRLNVVLNEADIKGGDTKAYRKYVQAISGVKVDVEDTAAWGLRLLSWFKSEQGGLRWGQNIARFFAIVLFFAVASHILAVIVDYLLLKYVKPTQILREFIVIMIKRGGLILGLLLALTALEISFGPILTLVGGVTFIVAFAMQTNLANFASGLLILGYKPFDIGDEIKVGQFSGVVKSISLANTTMLGFDGEIITIPNNFIWHDVIVNMTANPRMFKITLNIGLQEDLALVEQLLLEVAQSHPEVSQNPPPKTCVPKIESYYVKVFVKGWIDNNNYSNVYFDLNRMVVKRFQAEGISLAAIPAQETHFKLIADNQKLKDIVVNNYESKGGN